MYERRGIGLWMIVLLGLSKGVLGQSEETALDQLKGIDGETSCALKQKIYDGCDMKPSDVERPAPCTCNREFFNIMSACAYSSGSPLPIFKDWIDTCSISGINMDQAQGLADSDGWKVKNPEWARLSVPGNKTMDLQRAVILEAGLKPKSTASWSVIQIVLPIITAIVAIIATLLIMTCCRRQRATAEFGSRVQRLIRPAPRPRVKTMDSHDAEAWEIEPGYGPRGVGKTRDGETYRFADIPHTAGDERDPTFNPPTTPYTDKEVSSGIVTSPPSINNTVARSVPPTGVYPFGTNSAPQTYAQRGEPQPLFKANQPKKPSMEYSHERSGSAGSGGPFGLGSSIMSSMPWKKQPHKIMEVAPGKGFDINDDDHTTQADRSTFGYDLKSMDFHDRSMPTEEGGALSPSVESHPVVNPNTLSMESDIKIVSPTTDESYATPRNTVAGNIANANMAMPPVIPAVPPVPNYAPYVPPTNTRQKPGGVRPLPPSPPLRRQQSNASSVNDMYADPFTDNQRRDFSSGDDSRSFYTSPPPIQPMRTGSSGTSGYYSNR